jgi:hypothetical protein
LTGHPLFLAGCLLFLLIGKQGDQAGNKGERNKGNTGNRQGDFIFIGHFVRVPMETRRTGGARIRK